jgi:hypothetical protein
MFSLYQTYGEYSSLGYVTVYSGTHELISSIFKAEECAKHEEKAVPILEGRKRDRTAVLSKPKGERGSQGRRHLDHSYTLKDGCSIFF